MHVVYKKADKGQGELTITLDVAEMQPYLERAVKSIASDMTFEGFRPGTAPYAVVKARVGDMRLWETAAEDAVQRTYVDAVHEQKLETIGSPEIAILTLAPGNPFAFKATAALLPEVTIGDITKIQMKKNVVLVEDTEVEKTIGELQKMRTAEALVDRAATKADKVVVNMDMKLGGVPVEGGQVKGHSILLHEDYYVPGFTDALVGMRANETKNFTLPFPKDHYQKHIAGKPVEFTVAMQSVFALTPPSLDDAFAASLGQKTLVELRDFLRKNIEHEKQGKEDERQEIALLEQLVQTSTFGEIPDLLVSEETRRMADELERSVTGRGMEFQTYLDSIKKTRDQILLDFSADAMKRVKTMLLIRAVARQENITVTDAELKQETEAILAHYEKDSEMQDRIRSEQGQDYLRGIARNKKVIAFLKEKAIR